MRRELVERTYLLSAASILTLSGFAKLFSAGGDAKILLQPNAVFGFTNSRIIFGTGLIELLVAGYFCFAKAKTPKYYLGAWLGLNFVGYRILASRLEPGTPCPCMGTIGDMLPLSPKTIDRVLIIAAIYILVGNLLFCLAHLRKEQPGASVARSESVLSKDPC
jgi:methylamine utilization protein MauE